MSGPFYHTLHGDPVDAGLEPVSEGDFWMADDQPFVRENGQWVPTDDSNANNIWLIISRKGPR